MLFNRGSLSAGFVIVSVLPTLAQTMTDVSPQTPSLYGLEGSMIQMAYACNLDKGTVRDGHDIFRAPKELCVAATKDIVSRARRQFLASVGNDSEENPGVNVYGEVSVPMMNGKPAVYEDGSFAEKNEGTYQLEPKMVSNQNFWTVYQSGFDKPCNAVKDYGSSRDAGVGGFVEFVYTARDCISGISKAFALIHSEQHERVVARGYREEDITEFMFDAAKVLERIPLATDVAVYQHQ